MKRYGAGDKLEGLLPIPALGHDMEEGVTTGVGWRGWWASMRAPQGCCVRSSAHNSAGSKACHDRIPSVTTRLAIGGVMTWNSRLRQG